VRVAEVLPDDLRRAAFAALAVAGITQASCSQSTGSREVYPVDAGQEAAGGMSGTSSDAGATDAGGTCTSVNVLSDVVVGRWIRGEVPAASGGTIIDGTYDAVAFESYVRSLPPPDAQPPREFRSALRISAGATLFELVDAAITANGSELSFQYSGDLSVAPPSLLLSWMCPAEVANNRDTWQYSASGSTLTLFVENSTTTFVLR